MSLNIYSKAGADAAFATATQGALADATEVEQVTLTAPLAYTLPVGTPANTVHRVTFTQDASGGHTVTYGGNAVAVDTAAGASTLVEVWPGGKVTYPGAAYSKAGADAAAQRSSLGLNPNAPAMRVTDPGSLVVSSVGEATTWETPDGSGIIVHPCVRFFPEGKWGYNWWAVATPYAGANTQLENPCIYVSMDGLDFVAAPGVTNPLRPTPDGGAYNSDVHLVIGPDGIMHIFYRSYPNPSETIREFHSSDGVNWSADTIIIPYAENVKRLVSPAVWYDPTRSLWVLLAVEILAAPNTLERWTAPAATGPWTFDQAATITPTLTEASGVWHLDAIRLDSGQIVACLSSTHADGTSGNTYIAVSEDGGKTFVRGLTRVGDGGDYRSTIVPKITERGLAFDAYIGGIASAWGATRYSISAAPDISVSQSAGIDTLMAERRSGDWVLGDGFDRADAPGGLGTAPSGQSWTATSGVLQVLAGRACGTADTNQRATIAAGLADVDVAVDMSAATGNSQVFLIVRFDNPNNYIRVGYVGIVPTMQTITAGAVRIVRNLVGKGAGRHRVRVVAKGTTVYVYEDGVLLMTETVNEHVAATGVGLQTNTTGGGQFDNLTVRPA